MPMLSRIPLRTKNSIRAGCCLTIEKQTLKLLPADSIYANLDPLLSDQRIRTIKVAFWGADQSVFKVRHEFLGSPMQQLNDVYDYVDITTKPA